jgi:opacity protein-like surface antigen
MQRGPGIRESADLMSVHDAAKGTMMKSATYGFAFWAVLILACPGLANAQGFDYINSVCGGLGGGKFFDDEGSLGTGVMYRLGGEWRPVIRLGLEADLLGIHFSREDDFHASGNSQYFFVNAVYYFSHFRGQPYLKGGTGLFRTRYDYSFPASSPEVFRGSKTSIAVDFGAGIRFFVNDRWSVTPDFRVATGAGGYSVVSFLTISAAYHW